MSKTPVVVVTDSTAYLPDDVIHEYEIPVIPLNLNWEGVTLRDGVDITPEAFYQRLGTAREMPTTSQPSVGEFHELFQEVSGYADSVVGIFISDALSGTMDSARSAARELPDVKIELVDSKFTSMAMGFMVLAAARAARAGASAQEAAQAAIRVRDTVELVFVVDTLEFLHRGGRIGGGRRFVGSLLSVKPVLQLADGRIEALKSVRTKSKAMQFVRDYATEKLGSHTGVRLAVAHANAPEEAASFKQLLDAQFDPVESYLVPLSPVIGAHAGPGTVGVGFYADSSR
jgi:DegV family protein with EDD domain